MSSYCINVSNKAKECYHNERLISGADEGRRCRLAEALPEGGPGAVRPILGRRDSHA